MTTNETFFFRDKMPFDHLRETILPALLQARAGAAIAAHLVGGVARPGRSPIRSRCA